MKKTGFTVSEIVIALAVIGVIATFVTPMVARLFPDKNKAMVLKVHKTVQDINSALLDNTSLYYAQSNNDDSVTSLFRSSSGLTPVADVHPGVGFNSTLETFGRTPANVSGSDKYLALLTDNLELMPNTLENNEGVGSFRTRDGVSWIFNYLHFTIDVNGDVNPNCSYSAACTRPDRYNFLININNGNVSPNDPLTEAYLSNPDKMNDKANDFVTAENNLSNVYNNDNSNPFENEWVGEAVGGEVLD